MVRAGPAITRSCPSVSTIATSIPSSEVPLISPRAHHILGERSGPVGVPMLDDTAMATLRSPFLAAAIERGFVHQCTDFETLDERLRNGRVTGYIGYDCTADSLHVGSLVGIMLLRLFQSCGHKPIVLMGGGTTRIGDPSGKDEARRLLDDTEIARNMAGIRTVFAKFIDFGDGPSDAAMVNNADWLDELHYIPLLRDIGRHFSVNRMLTQDSVRLRLDRDQPLSFLEFNYPILQGYDFVELARRFGCELQIGGSDQWGNIVGGVELGRRTEGRALFGLTTPLIATASCGSSPSCPWSRSPTSNGSRAARSTKPRRSWRPRRRLCVTVGRQPRRPQRLRSPSSRAAAAAASCRRPWCRAISWPTAFPL